MIASGAHDGVCILGTTLLIREQRQQQVTRSSGVRLVMSGGGPSASSQPSSLLLVEGPASAPLAPCWLLGMPHLHGMAYGHVVSMFTQQQQGRGLLLQHDLQETAPVARSRRALLLIPSRGIAAAPSPVVPDRVCSTTDCLGPSG